MKITYWSDYVCPFCYIGEAHLKQAIKELGLTDITFEPKAYELDPNAPPEPKTDTATMLAVKFRISVDRAKEQIEQISAMGRDAGLDFKLATTQYTNTFNAHRLLKFACSKNNQALTEKVNDLLFDAFFTKNLKLSDDSTLLAVAEMAGLDKAETAAMLESGDFAADVREDERAAAELGVRGVPFFRFENGMSVSGAMPVEQFKTVLAQINELLNNNLTGKQCGTDGCN